MSEKSNWWVLFASLLLALSACGGDATDTGPAGSMDLNLQLAGDVDLDTVDYSITGNGIEEISGTIDVAGQSSIFLQIRRIPQGSGFLLELDALDGTTTCSATATFNITAGQVTPVSVVFICDRSSDTGGVEITGTSAQFCPRLTDMTAAMQNDGAAFAVSAAAQDEDGDLITFQWSAPSGSFTPPSSVDAAAATSTFNCDTNGDVELTVSVSDDGFTECDESAAITVTCNGTFGNPNLAICGNGDCYQLDSSTGAAVSTFISGGYTSEYRTIRWSGEMWHIERRPFGAHFTVHRYLADGTPLAPVLHDYTAEAPRIVATQVGQVYLSGTSAYESSGQYEDGAIYRLSPDASTLTLVVSAEAACGRYTNIFPVPPDALDPTKEEVLAMGALDASQGSGQAVFRVDLNDTDGDGVYCTEIVANLSNLGINYVNKVLQAPNGTVYVDNGDGCCYPNAGLHRIDNGQATLIRPHSTPDMLRETAIGSQDGLVYAVIGGGGYSAERLVTLDPISGAELSTLPGYVHTTGGSFTLDFFPQ